VTLQICQRVGAKGVDIMRNGRVSVPMAALRQEHARWAEILREVDQR
jgi:hypothetical protein